MLKRTISGTFYVVILATFFILRQFVDYRLFQLLVWFAMSVGTFEMARAVEKFSMKGVKIVATVFGIAFVPIYCLIEYLLLPHYGWVISIDILFVVLIAFAFVFIFKNIETKTFLISLSPFIYPALLMLSLLCVNDLNPQMQGFIALLLIFVISSLSDTMAYLVGMTYSKLRHGKVKKLCPKLSPNKTWAGAIGGTIGGVIGALAVYFIFRASADGVNFFSPILLYVLVGVIGSIVNVFGDLLESFIKRKVGIKDMGKIMPGHGGILDRIDGVSLLSAFILLVFAIV